MWLELRLRRFKLVRRLGNRLVATEQGLDLLEAAAMPRDVYVHLLEMVEQDCLIEHARSFGR
jgi:hypothetical protein